MYPKSRFSGAPRCWQCIMKKKVEIEAETLGKIVKSCYRQEAPHHRTPSYNRKPWYSIVSENNFHNIFSKFLIFYNCIIESFDKIIENLSSFRGRSPEPPLYQMHIIILIFAQTVRKKWKYLFDLQLFWILSINLSIFNILMQIFENFHKIAGLRPTVKFSADPRKKEPESFTGPPPSIEKSRMLYCPYFFCLTAARHKLIHYLISILLLGQLPSLIRSRVQESQKHFTVRFWFDIQNIVSF